MKGLERLAFALGLVLTGLQGVAQQSVTEQPAASGNDSVQAHCEDDGSEFDLFSVKSLFEGRALDTIEGVWHLSDEDEGVIAIVADPRHNSFEIRAVNASDRAVRPGTLIGTATRSAAPGVYDAYIFTRSDEEGRLSKRKNVILKVNERGGLVFQSVKNSWKLNFWKIMPYMFRYSFSRENNRPTNIDGAYRIFPVSSIATLPTHL